MSEKVLENKVFTLERKLERQKKIIEYLRSEVYELLGVLRNDYYVRRELNQYEVDKELEERCKNCMGED